MSSTTGSRNPSPSLPEEAKVFEEGKTQENGKKEEASSLHTLANIKSDRGLTSMIENLPEDKSTVSISSSPNTFTEKPACETTLILNSESSQNGDSTSNGGSREVVSGDSILNGGSREGSVSGEAVSVNGDSASNGGSREGSVSGEAVSVSGDSASNGGSREGSVSGEAVSVSGDIASNAGSREGSVSSDSGEGGGVVTETMLEEEQRLLERESRSASTEVPNDVSPH